MTIREAETDTEIAACHAVMTQLRPHVPVEEFVARVRRMQATGYRLAYTSDDAAVRAVAGFRYLDQLVHGLVIYVDDLVTDERERSRGHGEALLDWLYELARSTECKALELDSGVHRAGAHRFYFRHRMTINAFHFVRPC
ncbi:MAG: GNAT family N-acetyltransferase [Gemmatimonadaceae bacterium]